MVQQQLPVGPHSCGGSAATLVRVGEGDDRRSPVSLDRASRAPRLAPTSDTNTNLCFNHDRAKVSHDKSIAHAKISTSQTKRA